MNRISKSIRPILGLCLLLLLTLTSSCSSDSKSDDIPDVNNLTLILYMAGDYWDISGETFDKINAIADINLYALKSPDANILIYQDVVSSQGVPSLWKVKYSETGKGNSSNLTSKPTLELVKTYPSSTNSATKEVFSEVLADCFDAAPAQKYGLWFFSHGSGWLPSGKLESPSRSVDSTPQTLSSSAATRMLGVDGTTQMELSEFAEALPDNKFEFIVFEMCLTAGVEVAYELKDKTKYVCVSAAQMLSPGYRDIYSKILPRFFSKSSDMLPSIKNVADQYYNYWDAQAGTHRSATISVIRTEAMDEVAASAREIFAGGNAVSDISTLQIFNRDSYNNRLYFDFGQYMNELADTQEQKDRMAEALSSAVVYKAHTPYYFAGSPIWFAINDFSGMTVYIPQSAYPQINSDYKNTLWWQTTRGL